MANQPKKLTELQAEILSALRDGQLLTLDHMNMPWLGSRALQPQSRYFLTENRFITRKDVSRSIEATGNGFTISKQGLVALQSHESTAKAGRRGA